MWISKLKIRLSRIAWSKIKFSPIQEKISFWMQTYPVFTSLHPKTNFSGGEKRWPEIRKHWHAKAIDFATSRLHECWRCEECSTGHLTSRNFKWALRKSSWSKYKPYWKWKASWDLILFCRHPSISSVRSSESATCSEHVLFFILICSSFVSRAH